MYTDCLQNDVVLVVPREKEKKKYRLSHSFTFFVKLLASSLENKITLLLCLSLSREIIHSYTFHLLP
jgi:hypothetical protein